MNRDRGAGLLPFAVELRPAPGPARVVGRAATLVLARAILAAARIDYPGVRLVLRRGEALIEDIDRPAST
ncbi:MAG TPA: hypothetical protein VG248_02715 [Caulobacteraceae bacterium]|jgi:hypothetical protein|nr:hypothetical protein [Caulobacteraceae bacterium]